MSGKSLFYVRYVFILSLVFCVIGQSFAQRSGTKEDVHIIPYPKVLEVRQGSFKLKKTTVLVNSTDSRFIDEGKFLRTCLGEYFGIASLPESKKSSNSAIVFNYVPELKLKGEYRLQVLDSTIILSAGEGEGMFYAIQTLRQLLPPREAINAPVLIQAVYIEDSPAFPWRGLMLDVSRHFFSMSYLRSIVDQMAFYKLNKLHLHLTDDQGWRIEIKKYPRLTSEGAWRPLNDQDSACIDIASANGDDDFQLDKQHLIKRGGRVMYGGYYKQQEMSEFVRYAANRHIEVIPEIDMPGHMMAATRVFPHLTCDGDIGSSVGKFSNPICPCKDTVLTFVKDILTEIAALFPSKYIHIGGDEVNMKSWEKSPVIMNFMQEQGFTDTRQVQAYFNQYVSQFLKTKGKALMGWDEILDGGVDSTATVMFWRGWAPEMVKKTLDRGNKLILSPSGPLYFDAAQDVLSLSKVYHYDPLDSLMYGIQGHMLPSVLGIQANLWTEMIPSQRRADYMLFPRLTALSELGWSYHYRYPCYLKRLNAHYQIWDRLNINYRFPDLTTLVEDYVFSDSTSFFVSPPESIFQIRYTMDGTRPSLTSPILNKPLQIKTPGSLKLALFSVNGRRGDIYNLSFRNTSHHNALTRLPELADGLWTKLYRGAFKETTQIVGPPDSVFHTDSFTIPSKLNLPTFGLRFEGYIDIPKTGIYTFYLACNDGGRLYIGGKCIVNNDGLHPDRLKGAQVALKEGMHSIGLDFSEFGGGYLLDLKYSFNGSAPSAIPSGWLKHSF